MTPCSAPSCPPPARLAPHRAEAREGAVERAVDLRGLGEIGNLVGRNPSQRDLPRIWLYQAHHSFEDGAFARAVRAKNRRRVALGKRARHMVYGGMAQVGDG